MSDEQVPAYIARCKCGAIVMATVDVPEHAREIAKDIADCIRDGYAIERVTVGYVRSNWSACKCKKEPEKVDSNQMSLFSMRRSVIRE